jgi:hypothetical protein
LAGTFASPKHPTVIRCDDAGTDEHVILHDHQRGDVRTGLNEYPVADGRSKLNHRSSAHHTMVTDQRILPDHDVVTGLHTVTEDNAAVDNRSGPDVASRTDRDRAALARACWVTEFNPDLDNGFRSNDEESGGNEFI